MGIKNVRRLITPRNFMNIHPQLNVYLMSKIQIQIQKKELIVNEIGHRRRTNTNTSTNYAMK